MRDPDPDQDHAGTAGASRVSAYHLGRTFLELLPIDGVSLSMFDSAGQPTTLYASDETAARLDELQFDLGDGPLFTAYRTASPAIISSLQTDEGTHWPMFLREVHPITAGAFFVLPLKMGAVSVGVVSMYRREPGSLSDSDMTQAVALARSVAGPALRAASIQAEGETVDGSVMASSSRRNVHQAVGMVLAQMNVSATDAFASIRARAYSDGVTLHEVAQDVLALKIDFTESPD